MKTIRFILRAVAGLMFFAGLAVPEDSAGGLGLKIALLVTSLLLVTYSIVLPAVRQEQQNQIQFPRITKDIFKDAFDYEEWRKYAKQNDDYSRVTWWAFNLSPDEFLHFIRLVIELRYTADQKGLEHVAKYSRKNK